MTPRLARCLAGRGVTLIRQVFDGAPTGCVNLGLGQPEDPFPEQVADAVNAALRSRRMPYGPTAGLTELRARVAERVHGDGDPGSVLITAGSQQALFITLMGLVDPGEEVLFVEPAYPAYRMVAEMIGARAVAVEARFEDRWGLSVDALSRAWTPSTRAVVVASPANPTGMLAGDDAVLARLHALCEERDAWLIADEIYRPLALGVCHRPLHELGARVVSISGISKAFSCTGFRIGWLHADPAVVRGLTPLLQQVALCAPSVGQHAALACLDLWSEEEFEPLRARYRERRSAAVEALGELADVRFHVPDGAFYVFVDVSVHEPDGLALALRLRDEHGVITAPGEAFGRPGAGHLRISFAAEPDVVREGLARVAHGLSRG